MSADYQALVEDELKKVMALENPDGVRECLTRLAARVAAQKDEDGLLRLFMCEQCVEDHARNTQSISCYCDCHSSRRDDARWRETTAKVTAFLRGLASSVPAAVQADKET